MDERALDLADCLERLKHAADHDNWCEYSGYSARLVWNEIQRLRAVLNDIGEHMEVPREQR